MKIRGACGETAQDRSLDLAHVVEFSVDQGLAEVGGGLAVARRRRRVRGQIQFAHCDARQVADIQASQTSGRARSWVASPDVQRRREGMIAHIWRIVAGAASSLKRATGREIVVDPSYTGNVDGPGIENELTTRNRCPGGRGRQRRPGVKRVEDCGRKLTITLRYQPTWRLEPRYEGVDAGVDADKERLGREWHGSASCAVNVQSARVVTDHLCRKQRHLKIHDLLLLREGWPRPIPLRVAGGGIHRLVRQIVQKRGWIVRVQNLGRAGGGGGFSPVKHDRAQKTQVGSGQRPPVHRNHIALVAVVGIVYAHDLVVRTLGDTNGDANQPARAQQAISRFPSGKRRNVYAVVAVRAVVGAENRVLALGLLKPLLDVGGGNGHAVARLMA